MVNKFRNVKLFKAALADRDGSGILGIPAGRYSGENTLAIEPSRAVLKEVVRLMRFDKVAQQEGIEVIDVVKIDVEGFEYNVLKGFGKYLGKVKYMILEVHPTLMDKLGVHLERLYELLISHGFKLYYLEKQGVIESTTQIHTPNIIRRHHLLAVNSGFSEDRHHNVAKIVYDLTPWRRLNRRIKTTAILHRALRLLGGARGVE